TRIGDPMTRLNPRLETLLEKSHVPHQRFSHTARVTSQRTADLTHTPGREFAKTVILSIDGEFAMAVLPADRRVDLEKLRKWLDASDVRLATEGEMAALFPDCELGSEPPFGPLYDLPVYVSPLLS